MTIQLKGLSWNTETQESKILKLKTDPLEIKISMLVLKSCFDQCGESFSDYTLTEVKEKLQEVRDNLYNEEGYNLDLDSTEAFFINDEYSLDCLVERQESDLYVLGCFNAEFIADFIELDYDTIKTMQESESFTALGKIIKSSGNLRDMMESYISLDGAGHAFGSYDHSNDEVYYNDSKSDQQFTFLTMRHN